MAIDIPERALRQLAGRFRGTLIRPPDPAYGEARRVWNGMIDRYPAIVARCAGSGDVAAALAFGQEHGLPVAVRGGGHSIAGFGTCDSGLVIDLSPMREVRIDPAAGRGEAGGGARWRDLDSAAAAHGLATTGGLISTTGVGGFTLGGGIGWLMRRHGLACDNLVGAELVTPSGSVVNVDEESEPDLLWALRGGGGNFGIVTRFRFLVHPVSTVLGGMFVHRLDKAQRLIAEWDSLVAGAPEELTTMAAILTAPPEPFIPGHLHGQPILAIVVCWCGEIEAGERALAGLRGLGPPEVDGVRPMPYAALQQMLDAGAPAGRRNHWKSGQLRSLSPRVSERLVEAAGRMPSPFSQLHIHQLGGAVARVAPDATAYPHRGATHAVNVVAAWDDPADDDANVAWTRGLHRSILPEMTGVYANFLGVDADDRVAAAYGEPTYRRLSAIKARTDPGNVLRLNHNVPPVMTVPK